MNTSLFLFQMQRAALPAYSRCAQMDVHSMQGRGAQWIIDVGAHCGPAAPLR
jgi:hypothetical protein